MSEPTFICAEDKSLRHALELIELNKRGFILSVDSNQAVTGLATDGDIRRWLMSGGALTDRLAGCVNRSFVSASKEDEREQLLKHLDSHIRFIPVLDDKRRLESIVSRDLLPAPIEGATYARARAPVRVSFGGGGSDLTHYFVEMGGAVVNATISLYSHATLRRRSDAKIIIHSRDLNASVSADDLTDLLSKEDTFGLVKEVLRAIMPGFGFELWLHSDFPMKSGLGGSAVMVSSILGCFNELRHDRWDQHELAELAYQAERLYFGVAGGWQDQYAAVFGGFNFMEFQRAQNIVQPLRIAPDVFVELEENLVLCHTGIDHDSGAIHEDQKRALAQVDIQKLVKANVDLSYQMRNQLLRGKLDDFGALLDRAWQYKRQFSQKISSDVIDEIYDGALHHGAKGGKLLGAGGGGYFLFYVPAYHKFQLMDYLTQKNHVLQPFRFEAQGLQSWTMRDKNSGKR